MTTAKRLFWASAIGLLVGAGYGLGQRREKATERRLRQLFGEAANTNDLVDSFVTYIRDDARTNLKGFKDPPPSRPRICVGRSYWFRRPAPKPTILRVYWSITTRTQWVRSIADSQRNRSMLQRLTPARKPYLPPAGQIGSIQSGVAIANPILLRADVSLELTTLAGEPTGLTGTVTIPGNGQVAVFR